MKRFWIAAIGSFSVALAGCATQGRVSSLSERSAERLAAFVPTGEMTTCLSTRSIQAFGALTDNLILVQTRGNEHWLNRTVGVCSNAESAFSRLQYRTRSGQLCRGEIIQIFDNTSGIAVGSCSLGSFERLEPKSPSEESA